MNKALFACLALLAITATARPHNKLDDTRTVLAEMDKDPFGNAMISAVALNMAAKNPLDEINLVLQQILNDVQTQEDSADRQNKTRQDDCDQALTALRKAVSDLQKTIESVKNAISEDETALSNAQRALQQATSDLAETQQEIKSGNERRRAEHETWIARDYARRIDIATLEEGIKLINHMIHGVAFSQIKQRYDKVLENLQNSGSKHTLYKPLITALTELATKLNYENVMAILKLLGNIRQDTIDLNNKEAADEKESQTKWNALLATLLASEASLKRKINQLNAQIEALTKELESLRRSLEETTSNLESTSASLAAKEKQCAGWASEYALVKSDLIRKKELLNKLIQHMEERSAALEGYVKDRSNAAP